MRSTWPWNWQLVFFIAVLFSMVSESYAQPSDVRVYADEPTNGLRMPSFGLAGEVDATATVLNPAALHFLAGPTFGLVADSADSDEVTSTGQGLGLYLATKLGGNLLPALGLGIGLEFLEPSRTAVEPDPGSPRRFTLSQSMALGKNAALGLTYQRYWDENSRAIDGLNTFSAGWAARFGARMSAGFAIRDLNAPTVADTPVQRRYELEVVTRPLATDRLELGLGGRVGEVRGDIDGWLRWSVKIVRGLYFRGQASAVELNQLTLSPAGGTGSRSQAEYRLSAGLEVSFGGLGIIGLASGAIDPDDDASFRGGTLALRVSPVEIPSLIGEDKRIERIELKEAMDDRKLTAVAAQMRNFERDPDVVGVVVQIDDLGAGWATLQELRGRILSLRMAGKKVFAYLVAGTTGHYYLASAADKVFVDPAGGLRLVGYAATSLYFKKLFDMLGVKAQFVKIAEYKSAPEQWTLEGPSEPAWRQRNELLDSIYAQFISGVSESRNVDQRELRGIVDHGPYTAGDLANMTSLVDVVAEPEDLEKSITETLGGRFAVASKPATRPDRWSYPKVAIIYVTGDIVGGKSRRLPVLGKQLVGGDTIAQSIAQARVDPSVEAIVLRIDSPGGSALASEVMSREVFKTRGVKPIICSFGDLAASGGYFAAAGCDWIFAEPMTITGSIGIFNGTFDITGLLSRIGVTWTTFRRGDNADLESMFRTWTEADRAMLEEKIRYFYGRFVNAVAKGRNMKSEDVDKIARGRVWTGVQAKRIGLVDELGGVIDAIQLAKVRAGMNPNTRVELVPLPAVEQSFLEKLGVSVPGLSAREPAVVLPIPGGERVLAALPASVWAEPEVPQARLPFSLIWE